MLRLETQGMYHVWFKYHTRDVAAIQAPTRYNSMYRAAIHFPYPYFLGPVDFDTFYEAKAWVREYWCEGLIWC